MSTIISDNKEIQSPIFQEEAPIPLLGGNEGGPGINILSFDIEEWYIEKAFHGARQERYALFDRYLGEILDLLDDQGIQATFFVVGRMAIDFPDVVRLIDGRGHEIGCHSNVHTWLNKMSREQALADTRQAVDALEQCIGRKVLSYRAPAFSIGEGNKWAFEVLAECGIERDASVYPASRDFGGFPAFGSHQPTIINTSSHHIKEFPVTMAHVLSLDVAYSGGGYFRFFPLWFVRREISRSDYTMCYFHIGDLLPESRGMMSREAYENYFKERGTLLRRLKRHFKSNFGKKAAFDKMARLIKDYDFVSLDQADAAINWNEASVATLNNNRP